ncbi:MAG: nitrogenase iron-molybdenum cofactor biosynthesis protein NifN [Psychromonas sp.]
MTQVINQKKPLHVNPFKLSQPMGALIAFLGVKGCMPLMHGAQGCTNFTKVFFTRHFCEPIALQTTAVNDMTAVVDGGGAGIAEAVETIGKSLTPELVGLFSTGLTETKGDDLKAASDAISFPSVYVNTPDYQGGFESGFALTTQALIKQMIEPVEQINSKKALLLPHVSLQPIEVEKIKDMLEEFGYETYALPDISTSLDGHLGEKQGSLSGGGITINDLKKLGDCGLIVSIGRSQKASAKVFQNIQKEVKHLHMDSIGGVTDCDLFVEKLMEVSGEEPSARIKRWRARLCDLMLDVHFITGKNRFVLMGEPDMLLGLSHILAEVGGKIPLAVSSVNSPVLKDIKADRVLIGDMEDVENAADEYDIVIGNFHAERMIKRLGKGYVVRGFPNWEQIGNQLTTDVLYEGSAYFLKELTNIIIEETHCGTH